MAASKGAQAKPPAHFDSAGRMTHWSDFARAPGVRYQPWRALNLRRVLLIM